jgi:hypothetical protein
MTDTPAAPVAPVDPWSMTPDQVAAKLAGMDAAIHPPPPLVPQDAQDARATLERLSTRQIVGRRLVQRKCRNPKAIRRARGQGRRR